MPSSLEKLDAVIEVVAFFFSDAVALYEKMSGEKWSDTSYRRE